MSWRERRLQIRYDRQARELAQSEEDLRAIRATMKRIGYMPDEASQAAATLSDERAEAIWQRVVAAREEASRAGQLGRVRPLPARGSVRRHPRMLGACVAAAVVLALVGVAQPWSTPTASAVAPPLLTFSIVGEGETPGREPPAAQALGDLAQAASARARQPGQPSAGAGYVVRTDDWTQEIQEKTQGRRSAVVPISARTSVSADGAMDRVERLGRELTVDGRGLAQDPGDFTQPRIQHDRFPPGFVDTDLMSRLPRDPAALRARLLVMRQCATTGSAATLCLVQVITDTYNSQLVPADLEAAFWRVLAAEPDLRLLGTGTDRAGRAVEGIGLVTGGAAKERWIVLIQSTTGAFAGYEQVLLSGERDGVQGPAVDQFTTLLSAS